MTFASPNRPASWSWEATSEAVAERYGLPLEQIVRFDTNTAAAPPAAVAALLAGGRFELPLSEYPPSDYGRLVDAAARRFEVARDELLVGAGADEILDLAAKAFLEPGDSAVVPVPTYPMFGIVTEQRRAAVVRVPRLGARDGHALDVGAVRAAVAGPAGGTSATLVWLCSPNNPTGRAEPAGAIARLLAGLAADATAASRSAPTVILDEAYCEFGGESLARLRFDYPRLVVLRTMSKAYAIAGLRVGFAIAQPGVIEELAVYRPPGSVSIISVDVAAALLDDASVAPARVAEVAGERERLTRDLTAAGWSPEPSTTNFLLVDFASPTTAEAVGEALLTRGLVPRTFPAEHPLAHCLRLTVRRADENDRLIAAAREIGRPVGPGAERPGA